MKKTWLIHKLIHQILGSHELNGHTQFLTTFIQKSLKLLLAFLNLHQHTKNQFIPSTHSWDTVNFRVQWSGWPHPSLTMPTPKFFYQLLIYVNLCQHVKIRLFHWFVLEIWLIKKSCNLIGWEHFGPYLRNKNFSKYGICAGTQQII